jgi:hypothetical protein
VQGVSGWAIYRRRRRGTHSDSWQRRTHGLGDGRDLARLTGRHSACVGVEKFLGGGVVSSDEVSFLLCFACAGWDLCGPYIHVCIHPGEILPPFFSLFPFKEVGDRRRDGAYRIESMRHGYPTLLCTAFAQPVLCPFFAHLFSLAIHLHSDVRRHSRQGGISSFRFNT